MAPSLSRVLTVGAKDGLSTLACRAYPPKFSHRCPWWSRRGGVATTTCGAMAISSPQGIKVGNGTLTWGVG